MQRGVAYVDLGETLGEEELVRSRQPGRRQRRYGVEKVHSGVVVKVRDRSQPRRVHRVTHGDCFPFDRVALCACELQAQEDPGFTAIFPLAQIAAF